MKLSHNKPDRILRWPEVQKINGKSRTTTWRDEQEGKFPRRRQIGPNAIGWLESEINEWLSELPKVEGGKRGAA